MTTSSAEYFQRVAGKWDEMRSTFFSEAVRAAAIENAYLRPEMVVADVGAGTGFLAQGLAERVSRVHLVDASEAMLAEARANLAGRDNVKFHIAEGLAIPLESGSLDAVFASMYLHHCPDPQDALAEMVRLLRPGGRLVLTDLDAHEHAWLREEMADVWLGFSREQVRQWLRAVGLVNVQVKSTGQDCNSQPEAAAGEPAQISIFLATGTTRIARQETVSAHYGEHAERGTSCCGAPSAHNYVLALDADSGSCCGGGSSCCGPSVVEEAPQESPAKMGYDLADVADVPQEASEFTLGCGNPLALAGLKPGEVVLDIGSGGGLDAFLAARKVGEAGRVIGVDPTPAMLERARRSAERHHYANVEFRQGQADALPVADASVDVIISNCVINLTEDKGAVFAETFRALRPGGRLELSDMVTGGALPYSVLQDEEGWSGCMSGALPEQEYMDLIRQAGFEDVQSVNRVKAGDMAGVPLYSAIVRAVKPA